MRGTLGPDGEPCIDGTPWNDAESLQVVRAAAGQDVRLSRYAGAERFDQLPLSVLSDGAIAALGVDRRRLRPNVVVGGVEGLGERDWPGRTLRIGAAIVEVVKLRARCVMTTYDPDTQLQDPSVLRRIVADFEGTMALDCRILRPGRVALGDSVE